MSVTLTSLPELNRRAFAVLVREIDVPGRVSIFQSTRPQAQGTIRRSGDNYLDSLTLEEYREALRFTPAVPPPGFSSASSI